MDDRPDLASLVAAAQAAAVEWDVSLGAPFALSRYSYVAPAGGDAVLKVTPAGDEESDHEGDALALWAGAGAVRLLRRDAERRALLIERALPGEDASTIDDEEATRVAIAVGKRLWRPAGAPFRPVEASVRRWLDNAEGRVDAGKALIPLARRLLDDELRPRHEVLVHGDFHHHNLLRHGDGWVAIDPKPYLAEPEFDVPSFLWNPLLAATGSGSMPLDRTRRRLAAFEAAGLDPWRMRAWTVVRGAYLGADGDEVETILALLDP